MPLQSGVRLGPYEILAPLGAGGMGEVYKAKDSRVERTVALKVLPEEFFENKESIARFEREARMLASLNHPNIAHLYSFEEIPASPGSAARHLLVMELADGQTLAERLLKGPMALDQMLKTSIEIASALDAAHRAGIVHRDLKPGNVMLTKSGTKLLDFGLAKVAASPVQPSPLTSQPTELPKNLTQKGTILGTFQYMSPEQLEGKEADPRTDIFAFGAVLYEMATGRKAFEAKSQASLISAIMSSDPQPISTIQPMSPPALDRVVKVCLAKDPEDRWQSAHDVVAELKWIAEGGSQAGVPAPVVSRRRNREAIAWSLAAIAIAAAALLFRRADTGGRTVRLSLLPPPKAVVEHAESAAISPDGRLVAFVGVSPAGKRALFLRPLAALSATALGGTDDALDPFWSPDGRFIGFFASGKLKRIEAAGGPAQVLCDAPEPRGAAWSREGVIVFAPRELDALYRVPAAGGAPVAVTKLDPKEEAHRWPSFLPDGRHFVFLGDSWLTEDHSIRVGSLDSLESERLFGAVSNVAFASPGHLLYVRAGSLLAQSFDAGRRKTVGEPTVVGQQIAAVGVNHHFDFSASPAGVLVYRSADPEAQLVWFDRSGKHLGSVGEPGRFGEMDLSPDGQRLVFSGIDADGRPGNLWLVDLARGTTSRLTTEGADYCPVWSADSKKVLFASMRSGMGDIYERTPGGGGSDRLVLKSPDGKCPMSSSPDGRLVLIGITSPKTKDDLWLLPVSGDGKPRPYQETPFREYDAQFSPDGRWVAYVSDESGRGEVYVQALSDPSSRVQVSSRSGTRPRWRGDGKELFFFAGSSLMAADVRAGSTLDVGKPKELFRLPVWTDYAVSRDGQRILAATSAETDPFHPPTVVLNWAAELKKP